MIERINIRGVYTKTMFEGGLQDVTLPIRSGDGRSVIALGRERWQC